MESRPIIFIPHPALYNSVPGSPLKPPSPSSPFERLKHLDELLNRWENSMAEARQAYQQTLQEFATQCHELWKQEKSQGSRQGKGFRTHLQDAGIKVGRAYRAMKKFFPADFPPKSKAKTPKALTLSAADEVGLCFTGKVHEGKEVLQCVFALTAEEKAQFVQCLQVVDAAQVQRLLLEAVKQAALQAHAAPEFASAERPAVADDLSFAPALAEGSQEPQPPRAETTNQVCPRGEPASRRDAACNTLSSGRSVPDQENLDAQPGTNEQLLPLSHQLPKLPNDRTPQEGRQPELPK